MLPVGRQTTPSHHGTCRMFRSQPAASDSCLHTRSGQGNRNEWYNRPTSVSLLEQTCVLRGCYRCSGGDLCRATRGGPSRIQGSATRGQVSGPTTRARRLKAWKNDSSVGGHGVGADNWHLTPDRGTPQWGATFRPERRSPSKARRNTEFTGNMTLS